MKVAEVKNSSVEELEDKLKELHEEQLRMRCNKAVGQLLNTSLLREGRRDIARINTILTAKRNNR